MLNITTYRSRKRLAWCGRTHAERKTKLIYSLLNMPISRRQQTLHKDWVWFYLSFAYVFPESMTVLRLRLNCWFSFSDCYINTIIQWTVTLLIQNGTCLRFIDNNDLRITLATLWPNHYFFSRTAFKKDLVILMSSECHK